MSTPPDPPSSPLALKPEHILCPVRGGPQSAPTVEAAIDRALLDSAALTFLFIVDVGFLSYATVAKVNYMVEEISETGRFAMSRLCDKARERGVKAASSRIERGSVRDGIIKIAAEVGATTVVLGRPHQKGLKNMFSSGAFDTFVQSLESLGQFRIVVVDR